MPPIAFLLKYWRWIAGALLLAAALWWLHSYGQSRYDAGDDAGSARIQLRFDAFKAAQAQLATDQLKQQQAALLARQQQTQDADDERTRNMALIASLRSVPSPRLRCTAQGGPSGDAVPTPATSAAGSPAGAGKLQEGGGASFNPVPAVNAMADRADDLVEACRSVLARWPR